MDTRTLRQQLAENVKLARERGGLSKSRLCLMAGISRPILDGIERGDQHIKLNTLCRLSVVLEKEPCELLR